MSHIFSSASLLFLAILANAAPTVQLGNTTVTGAAFGNIEFYGGIWLEDQNLCITNFFIGIPYAEPPIGSLRFKHPVPIRTFGSPTLDASRYGMACLQAGVSAPYLLHPFPYS
jgi:hypothetical protein